MKRESVHLAIWLLLIGSALGPGATAFGEEEQESRDLTLRGKVVMLAEAFKAVKPAVKSDPEPIARQAVLAGEDGKIVPLISDEASRALFLDERLRNRPTELRGKMHPLLPYFQVVTIRIEEDGRLQTPEYYCNICTISVRYPQTCPCCQGEMELRMKPDRR